jgi:hypothetical protein
VCRRRFRSPEPTSASRRVMRGAAVASATVVLSMAVPEAGR